jgi:hypothetical protein
MSPVKKNTMKKTRSSRVWRLAGLDVAKAFDAVAAMLSLGSVAYEVEVTAKGERLVWLESRVVDKLAALRGPDESYRNVILRLVQIEASDRIDHRRLS